MPRDWPLTGRSGQQARAMAALRGYAFVRSARFYTDTGPARRPPG